MNIDLPPLSAFIPDAAIARPRPVRDTFTLTEPPETGQGLDRPAAPGTLSCQLATASGTLTPASYRLAVAASTALALTITF